MVDWCLVIVKKTPYKKKWTVKKKKVRKPKKQRKRRVQRKPRGKRTRMVIKLKREGRPKKKRTKRKRRKKRKKPGVRAMRKTHTILQQNSFGGNEDWYKKIKDNTDIKFKTPKKYKDRDPFDEANDPSTPKQSRRRRHLPINTSAMEVLNEF